MLIWHLPQIRRPLPTAQAVAYTLIQRTAHALAKMLIANIINYAYYIVNLLFLFLVHFVPHLSMNTTIIMNTKVAITKLFQSRRMIHFIIIVKAHI